MGLAYLYLFFAIFSLGYLILMNKFNQEKRNVKLVRKLFLAFGVSSLLSFIGMYYYIHLIEFIGRIGFFIVIFIIFKDGKNLAKS